MKSKTSIVLVHGAWADGSSWGKVIPFLQEKGFNVTAAQIPLTSLADDIVVTRNLLAAQKGPTVLAGHSYSSIGGPQCSTHCSRRSHPAVEFHRVHAGQGWRGPLVSL
jgi:pimeloyl-ACP methyl ester carboxylesterase